MASVKNSLVFFEELSTLINSGVSALDALRSMADYLHNARFKKIATTIKSDLARGASLSEAMAGFPFVFPAWQINIVKYSELSGTLKEGAENIVRQLRGDLAVRRSLLAGLAYPVLLFHLAVLLLPVAAGFAKGLYVYFSQVAHVLVPVYGVLGALFLIKSGTKLYLPYQHDVIVLYFPFLGGLVKNFKLTRFVGVLQCLCGAGVNIVQGWKIAADSCDNLCLRDLLLLGSPVIEKGGKLSDAFLATGVFPRKTLSMVAVGEAGGAIDAVLGRIAAYTRAQNDTTVALLLTIVPVVIYLSVAAYIGWRVISFYSGYFSKVLNY